ncbi:MAG TPA: tyrosine-type recombinase/integrase [Bacillales bacterium]|nr:tyrosine-type recombinase/integrase [Bacillales bacterium]
MQPEATFNPILATEVIQSANQFLHAKQYSDETIYQYNRMWKHLVQYADRKQILFFTPELCMDFLIEEKHVKSIRHMNKYERYKYRSIKILIDIAQKKQPSVKYTQVPNSIPPQFMDIFNGYQDYMEQRSHKTRTIITKMSRIKVLFNYLDSRNTNTITHLDFQAIQGFILFLQGVYSPVAKSNILFTLRDFLRYAEHFGMVPSGVSEYVNKIYVGDDSRLPSYYTSEETTEILRGVDCGTAVGKRDYAILLIAISLGMRAGDICHLHISDIDWEGNEISFIQQKTGNYQTLPMTDSIRYALADYLKNGRPDTASSKLFIKIMAPYEGFSTSSALYRILNKYMDKVGIHTEGKRHGMHAMRHSLSSKLLEKNTPLPVVSGILGHSSTKVTSRYLWMNTEQLRKVSLEVPYGKQ